MESAHRVPSRPRDRAAPNEESRLRALLDGDDDGVLVIGRDGRIRHANPVAARLLGEDRAALVGRDFGIPLAGHGRSRPLLDLTRDQRGRPGRVAELRAVDSEWAGEPAFIVHLRDVTRAQRSARRIRRLTRQLAEADRRQEAFLATLAHELRNPLAPILYGLEVLERGGQDPQTRAQAHDLIEHEVRRMSRLVEDLLEVARTAHGRIPLQPEIVDVAGLVERAAEATRPLFADRGQTFAVEWGDAPARIAADPAWMVQALVHLLVNASKYTDSGGAIVLRVEAEPDQVIIRVRDNGIGIARELLPRIFDLYTQAAPGDPRARGGLGIGLNLVHHLVRLHGGSIEARSAGMGRGSEFVVRLPRAPERPAPPPAPPADPAAPARPLRVLIVDDNHHAADSLAQLLRIWRHDPAVAYDGGSALDLAARGRFDAVLLDVGLPDLDGHEVARRLRERAGPDRPVLIALTGRYPDDDPTARDLAFDHYLLKPVDIAKLEGLLAGLAAAPGR